MKHVIVVGGGAAGMMAAIAAAENGAKVSLYEKNEKLGKKIYITGKGRCNVTNGCDAEDFFGNVVTNSKFMYSSFYNFDNTRVVELFESNGCQLKNERGNRVFPVSDHSSDVIACLHRIMKIKGVDINLNSKVERLLIKDNTCCGIVLFEGKKTVLGDEVVVATGGVSYPSTGSTGDGMKWAKDCEHNIIECKPALVPFVVKEDWVKDLQGLSLKNVGLEILAGSKKIYSGFGEMMFTHFGVTGPLVLSASSYYSQFIRRSKDNMCVKLNLDLKNALSYEQLDKRILRDFEQGSNKKFRNGLNDLLPSKIIPVIIELSGIDGDKTINLITREERTHLVELLKKLELTIEGTRDFNEAIITQGGVSVKDINPSTMESKKIDDLYFCGEVVDVDALTGGFNLQVAWSTGYLAGESAATKNTI